MKTIITIAASIFFTAVSAFAQTDTSAIGSQANNLSQLLTVYYGIKDALVAGNAATASAQATAFVKVANGIDYKVISEGNINALLKDASAISEASDLKKQRQVFANFSNNMTEVAKAVKLTTGPVYRQYCPMKKASWLSNDKGIKNPYYGNAMLTCGEVAETINQ